MSSRIRLSDVARHAKVSTATVSRVVNDRPGVAKDKRRAVLAALDVLGYERPTESAPQSSGLIGLIVPELSNPVFPLYAQEIEQVLSTEGYMPLLCTQSPGGITEDEYVRTLLDRHVAGIIFVSGLHADSAADPERYTNLADTPFVTINGPNPEVSAPSFSCDDEDATARAFDHLVTLGHTRIGLAVGPQRFIPTQRKVAGFTAAHQRAGLNTEPHISSSLYTMEGGQAAAAELLRAGCTAIICASDMMAMGAVRQIRQLGLRVPDDISIVGYDDTPLIAYTDPPLTTIRQPVGRIARAAAGTLIQMIDGRTTSAASLVFAPELVVRASTGVLTP